MKGGIESILWVSKKGQASRDENGIIKWEEWGESRLREGMGQGEIVRIEGHLMGVMDT